MNLVLGRLEAGRRLLVRLAGLVAQGKDPGKVGGAGLGHKVDVGVRSVIGA